MLIALILMTSAAWAQEAERDRPFILGWNGHFAHGEVVTLNSSDLAREKSGLVRVALGNHPDLDQCTRQEPQAIHDWGADSVAFEVDAEGFNTGDQVYVFLIEEDGTSAGGFAVTLGDQIPHPEGPGQPGQPTMMDR